jgi:hypothetical protein
MTISNLICDEIVASKIGVYDVPFIFIINIQVLSSSLVIVDADVNLVIEMYQSVTEVTSVTRKSSLMITFLLVLEGELVMMGTFLVANYPAVILFDSGASHTFLSKNFVEKHCIPCTESREGFIIHSPGGRIFTKEVAIHIPVVLAGREFSYQHVCFKGPRHRCNSGHELVSPA